MANIFTISAFFIVLREVLEACLVVGIVLAYLEKSGDKLLRPYVWAGAAAGILLSLVVGVTFTVIYYRNDNQLFTGKAEYIFEGIAFLFAAALLTWMILWMLAMGRKMQQEIEDKVDKALQSESTAQAKIGIASMVFIQVLREGIETFIFLFGAAGSDGSDDAWKGIILPGILGLIVGLIVAYLVFRGLVTLDIQSFFLISSLVLMAFAAGLVSHGLHELQEADWFGPYDGVEIRDWWNAKMWSTKDCCNDKTNEFFAMLRALFGYQDTPSFIELTSYFAYWAAILAILLAMNWSTVKTASKRAGKYSRGCAFFSLCSFFVGFIYACINATWTGLVVTIIGLILSVVACAAVFGTFAKFIPGLNASRRTLASVAAVGSAVFGLFVCVLHIVQLTCLEIKCRFPSFYYWGLIFTTEWIEEGNTGKSYNSVAVLSWSFVFSFFFFACQAIAFYIYSLNMTDKDVAEEAEKVIEDVEA